MNSVISRGKSALTLAGLMLGVLLSALDSTIVGTAMPHIIRELNGLEHYSLPFTAYMLCASLAIPIFGKLSDLLGRKQIYLAGIIIFTAGSLLCGLAGSLPALVAFRGLQGLGGGILVANAFAITGVISAPEKRGRNISIIASMFGLASIIGPALGGAITDLASWRWIFYINLPVGIAALILIARGLPREAARPGRTKIDVTGIILLVLTLAPLILALSMGGKEWAWDSPLSIGAFALFAAALAVFIRVESGKEHPIVPVRFFGNRVFLFSIIGAFLSYIVFFGAIIYIPLYLQRVLGHNATLSGFTLTPTMLSFTVASIVSGQIVSRTGRYKAIYVGGFVTALAGAVMLLFLTPAANNLYVIAAMVVLGLGLGAATPIFNIAVQGVFPPRHYGVVTSAIQLFRNIGAALGGSLFGIMMTTGFAAGLNRVDWGNAPPFVIDLLKNPRTLMNAGAVDEIRSHLPAAAQSLFDHLLPQLRGALADAILAVFGLCVAVAALALLAAFFLKEAPPRQSGPAANAAGSGVRNQDTVKAMPETAPEREALRCIRKKEGNHRIHRRAPKREDAKECQCKKTISIRLHTL